MAALSLSLSLTRICLSLLPVSFEYCFRSCCCCVLLVAGLWTYRPTHLGKRELHKTNQTKSRHNTEKNTGKLYVGLSKSNLNKTNKTHSKNAADRMRWMRRRKTAWFNQPAWENSSNARSHAPRIDELCGKFVSNHWHLNGNRLPNITRTLNHNNNYYRGWTPKMRDHTVIISRPECLQAENCRNAIFPCPSRNWILGPFIGRHQITFPRVLRWCLLSNFRCAGES